MQKKNLNASSKLNSMLVKRNSKGQGETYTQQ